MYSSCFEENSIIPYRFMVAWCLILVTTVKVLIIGISFGFCTDDSDTRDSMFANPTTSAHFSEDCAQPQNITAVSVER